MPAEDPRQNLDQQRTGNRVDLRADNTEPRQIRPTMAQRDRLLVRIARDVRFIRQWVQQQP